MTVELSTTILSALLALLIGFAGAFAWASSQLQRLDEKWQKNLHDGFSDISSKFGDVHSRVTSISERVARLEGGTP